MRIKAAERWMMVVIVLAFALSGCSQSGSETADNMSGSPAANSAQRAPARQSLVLDAGTTIPVFLDHTVSSKTNNSGDNFDATVASAVMSGDREVIPKGAHASGTVTSAKSAGRFKGNAELGIALTSVTVNGQTYDVQTSPVVEVSSGRGKRTAIGAGGGAAAGAIIGAIAGGGKGAAIGAGAGAGAGTAGAAMTGERDITLPVESRVSFKLTQSLTLR